MSTYYAVTLTGDGFPTRFLCGTCFDLTHEYDRAASVDRCEADSAIGEAEEIGCSCSMCNEPLARVDADVVLRRLDIDLLMSGIEA